MIAVKQSGIEDGCCVTEVCAREVVESLSARSTVSAFEVQWIEMISMDRIGNCMYGTCTCTVAVIPTLTLQKY